MRLTDSVVEERAKSLQRSPPICIGAKILSGKKENCKVFAEQRARCGGGAPSHAFNLEVESVCRVPPGVSADSFSEVLFS